MIIFNDFVIFIDLCYSNLKEGRRSWWQGCQLKQAKGKARPTKAKGWSFQSKSYPIK